jgi:predicted DNA-binding ribbon-helix-helix protein
MPIDPSIQVNASVVLEKDIYEKLKEVARRNKRSVSKQIAFWVEQQLGNEEKSDN